VNSFAGMRQSSITPVAKTACFLKIPNGIFNPERSSKRTATVDYETVLIVFGRAIPNNNL
jgi:hypothetical protein